MKILLDLKLVHPRKTVERWQRSPNINDDKMLNVYYIY